MRAYQKRKEAKALVSAINNSRIIFCPDSDENIWKGIIDETRKCTIAETSDCSLFRNVPYKTSTELETQDHLPQTQ